MKQKTRMLVSIKDFCKKAIWQNGLKLAFGSLLCLSTINAHGQLLNGNFEGNPPFFTAAFSFTEFIEYSPSGFAGTPPSGYTFSSISNWTVLSGLIDLQYKDHGYMSVPVGGLNYNIDLNDIGAIRQLVTLAPSTTYTLNFSSSVHSGITSGKTATAKVSILNSSLATIGTPLTISKSYSDKFNWNNHTLTFTTTAGTSYYIKIEGLTSSITGMMMGGVIGGVLIDNLSLSTSSSTGCDESCYWTIDGNSPATTSTKNILGTKTAVDVRLFAGGLQRGVLTKDGNFGWGTGTGAPSSRFHVNLTSTILGNGLRFQDLPLEPALPEVLVVDINGNVGRRPVSTLTGGPSGTGWGLLGNSISTTDFIGTTINDDFRFRTNSSPRGMITRDGNFDFGSNTFSVSSLLHDKSLALGKNNSITNSTNSIATGELNEIQNSTSSGVIGYNNKIIYDDRSIALGSQNYIHNSGGVNVALCIKNEINNCDQSVVAGEENYLEGSHGSFIGGSHNSSTLGWYCFMLGLYNTNYGDRNVSIGSFSGTEGIGNYAFGTLVNSIGSFPLTGDQDQNIFTFGHKITNRRSNSMIFGFDNNRTEVITKRGVAIQLQDPSPLLTYNPTVNFEVQAGVFPGPTSALTISSVKSNVRFHNLPPTNKLLPPVVIDPITGELFLYDPGAEDLETQPQMRPNDSLIKDKDPKNNFQNIVNLQQAQITELQKQIDELKSALNTNSTASNGFEDISKDGYLAQNVPNPFSVSTNIQYELPKGTENASIGIYDMNGKEIKLIQLSLEKTGNVSIKGGDLMPGMYLYTLIINGKYFDSKKMILTSQ